MSTATEESLEALLSQGGDELKPLHLACGSCWPEFQPGITCLCGHVATGLPDDPKGRHHCAKCLAISFMAVRPCGHPCP